MSSWTSHLAAGAGAHREDGYFARVAVLGMNRAELQANPAAHDHHVHDLNREPRLAMFADESFDAVFCSVRVHYLAQPMALPYPYPLTPRPSATPNPEPLAPSP